MFDDGLPVINYLTEREKDIRTFQDRLRPNTIMVRETLVNKDFLMTVDASQAGE